MSWTGDLSGSGNTGTGVVEDPANSPSWVGNATERAASSDYFLTSSGSSSSATFTLGGFDVGDTVALDFFASRNSNAAGGLYEYSVDNGTSWSGFTVLKNDGTAETAQGWDTNNTQNYAFNGNFDASNNDRYMNAAGLTIGASGNLLVKMSGVTDFVYTDTTATDYTASGFAIANAMRVNVIPEPSAFMLVFTALGTLIIYRRRS